MQGQLQAQAASFAPQLPQKPSMFNIGQPGRDRSRSGPPGDELMPLAPPPPPPPPAAAQSAYGP
eukprot:10483378-Karenia_brevis.AAC.1